MDCAIERSTITGMPSYPQSRRGKWVWNPFREREGFFLKNSSYRILALLLRARELFYEQVTQLRMAWLGTRRLDIAKKL